MLGRLQTWLGCGLAALLLVAAPAVAGEFQYAQQMTDPGYRSQAVPGQLVSNKASTMNFEARISALEAALAEEEREALQWQDVSGQKWSLKIGGSVFGDLVLYPWVDPAIEGLGADYHQNYFEFRRLRLFFSGSGYGVYDYKFNLDFQSGDATMKDVYVGIHEIPLLGYVRFGHYYAPVGLESQTSSKYITFMERAMSTVIFGSDRRLGVSAYRRSSNAAFYVHYGAFLEGFNNDTFEVVNDNQGVRAEARGTWTPVYTANGRGVLHFGVAGAYIDAPEERVQFRNRPEVHKNKYWLDTGVMNARHYTVLGVEAASVYGPLSFQTEFFYTKADGVRGTDDADLYGAYAYASYFLTGEHRNFDNKDKVFGRVKPNTNFWIVPTSDGPAAGWGAWELAGRWSYLDYTDPSLNNVVSAGQMTNLTVGLNWYWNPYTRVMFEWIHPFLNRNDIGAAEADILGMRMQYDF